MSKTKTGQEKKGSGTAPFWHPLVHRQFGEELFYFLIAAKPFDEAKLSAGVQKLMGEFGINEVNGYCAYQIFGQFDMLVRVWLPAGQEQQFMDRAVEQIATLNSIVPFHATKTNDKWRFKKALDDGAKSQISTISPKQVAQVQKGNDENQKDEFRDLGLYSDVVDYRSKNADGIKAFISISEPTAVNKAKRDAIFEGFIKILEDMSTSGEKTKRLAQPTVYSGYGFTWVLIKVVAPFYLVYELIDRLAHHYREDGISTSTYLVASHRYKEGECISRRSLEAKEGDENVRLFLPELYSTPDLDEAVKEEIERFVKTYIIKRESLELKDKLALQGFLRAVVLENAIDAFTALFPRFVQTEQELRDLLVKVAVKTDGGIERICKELDPDGRFIKSVKTMPLSFVLKGCRMLALRLVPADVQSIDLADRDLEEVASFRNKIMHGADFDGYNQWKPFAQATVNLADIRKQLSNKLNEHENSDVEKDTKAN